MGVNSETTPETDIAGTLSQNTGSQIMRDKIALIIADVVIDSGEGVYGEFDAADAIIAALQAENAKLREAADELADAVHNEAAARGSYIAIKPDRGGATGPKGKARHKWFVSRCAVSDALTAYCSTQSETTALSGQDAEGET